MTRIAILSDTHGLLREQVNRELVEADCIIHAGDLNTPAIVEALREQGEAYLVRGNNDKEWAEDLPHSLTITIEEVSFFIVHQKKDIPKNLSGIDVVIYGHSHQYKQETRDGILFLNPGSCGKRRFDLDITLCRMMVYKSRYQVEKILIPQEG